MKPLYRYVLMSYTMAILLFLSIGFFMALRVQWTEQLWAAFSRQMLGSSFVMSGVIGLLAAFILASLFILVNSLPQKQERPLLKLENENGKIGIAQQTVEHIVNQEIRLMNDVHETNASVTHCEKPGHVLVELDVQMNVEKPLPKVTREFQTIVMKRVKSLTGVQVDKVSINYLPVKPRNPFWPGKDVQKI
jgi:uncharacterized alkaline shock family protein YloU